LERGLIEREEIRDKVLRKLDKYQDFLLLKILTLQRKPLPAEVQLSEVGLTVKHIEMVMSQVACTRNEAIRALRDSKDDCTSAILSLVI
jgi:NACalpha-BTF3-like transcription factor